MTGKGGGIDEGTLGSLDADIVSDLEEGKMARDETLFVRLEQKVNRPPPKMIATVHTLTRSSKWPRSSSLLMGV